MKIEIEELNKAYDRLSEGIKEVYDAEETALILLNIGKKYNLHVDQTGELATVFHAVILGLIKISDLIPELKKNVGVSDDVANLIVYDLNQQIFSKIRQEMQKIYVPEKTPEQIIEQKLTSVTNVPKQEVEVNPQTGDNKSTNGAVAAVPARDPYRESF